MIENLIKKLRCNGCDDEYCKYLDEDNWYCDKDKMMCDAADAIEKLTQGRKQPDEIVKCRECRFYDNGTCLSPKTTYTELRREDWFCADGKRKEQI